MVKKITEHVLSDLSGDEVKDDGGTVSFVVEGTSYEIDLTAAEKRRFEDALAEYVAAARTTSHATKSKPRASRKDTSQIRAWAAEQGLEMSARGRIPTSIVEAYREATTAK